MDLAAKIALLLAAAFCFAVQAVYFTHMLQLNSYRDERYARWCGENSDKLFNLRRMLPILLMVLAFLPLAAWVRDTIAAGVLLLTGALCWPKKAKKPLVVTARVKRLFAVQGLVLAVALVLAWFFAAWRSLFLLGLFCSVVWFWVRVAALLASPVEKAIANRYVEDARRRLAAMPNLRVIGITGSYGKTSTKTFLHALLSVKYNVLMTPENFNTTLGVVRTVREHLRPTHQIFLAEMGAKNVGDIKEICDLVHPEMGVITSIGEQHLETFGHIDNIIKTKFELADALPGDGVVFLNFDNAYIRERAVNVEAVSYGLTAGDYTVGDIAVDATGSHFTVTAPNGEQATFATKLLGAHNIQNLVGYIAVAH
ncbi:MAG: UDP-N-acetylmuramoyl-tripeptide--D-alanyl-D-alanine ligase, partial [Clostridia bacterium]|nr:UDP-N-acetylmuramoyl-tripeptide--D-alanyl-D-alanine ligase [Clostridia bacterium]